MINNYIERFPGVLPGYEDRMPWEITEDLAAIVSQLVAACGDDYRVKDGVAIHKNAIVEQNVVIIGPAILGADVSVGANAYLRGPILLDSGVRIGAGCEIKQSVIFMNTAIAHFNYIGNSLVGSHVNFEAGSVAANHYNERENKIIHVLLGGKTIDTGVKKFGSLLGDGSRIGANAVLSPGTILSKGSVVKRLELVEQLPV